MKVEFIRHATFQLEINQKKLLVDPMFSSPGEMDSTPSPKNQNRNPLVPLPFGLPNIEQIDGIIVTHTHRDHFDDAAAKLLPKDLPLFCQPMDQQYFKNHGFTNVIPVHDFITWNDIRIIRTIGRHGRGEMEQKMGPVSGFVFESKGEPLLYLTGDTVWCTEVEHVLKEYRPEVIIAFAGAAEFPTGGPITMSAEDINVVCKTCPEAKIIAMHMDAWNHCLLTRNELKDYTERRSLSGQILIPNDGDLLVF